MGVVPTLIVTLRDAGCQDHPVPAAALDHATDHVVSHRRLLRAGRRDVDAELLEEAFEAHCVEARDRPDLLIALVPEGVDHAAGTATVRSCGRPRSPRRLRGSGGAPAARRCRRRGACRRPRHRVRAPELRDALAQERHGRPHPGDMTPPGDRQRTPRIGVPPQCGRKSAGRHPELEARDDPARADDAGDLAKGRAGVGDVAQQIGERGGVERCIGKRQPLGLARRSVMRSPRPAASTLRRPWASMSALWSMPVTRQPVRCGQLDRDRAGAGRDVEHMRVRADRHPLHQESAPGGVLAQGQQRAAARGSPSAIPANSASVSSLCRRGQ